MGCGGTYLLHRQIYAATMWCYHVVYGSKYEECSQRMGERMPQRIKEFMKRSKRWWWQHWRSPLGDWSEKQRVPSSSPSMGKTQVSPPTLPRYPQMVAHPGAYVLPAKRKKLPWWSQKGSNLLLTSKSTLKHLEGVESVSLSRFIL